VTSADDIKAVIASIRMRRNKWILSRRPKNIKTLQDLAITDSIAFDFIYQKLVWQDYISGPEPDNHAKRIPGEVWVFGLALENRNCYLKFQDRPNGVVIWISLHIATFPLVFPFK